MHTAIQLIFDPQHDIHRAQEVERAWRAQNVRADRRRLTPRVGSRMYWSSSMVRTRPTSDGCSSKSCGRLSAVHP
jgi:hypothetical protein